MKLSGLTALGFSLGLLAGTMAFADAQVNWQDWNAEVFQKAGQEHKLVLLDLEAVWCHWCHVMNQSTYGDPAVIQEINEHFLPVRVDQDSRPDLANRFRDYGWPATIIFNAKGIPLVKRAGYIEPTEMNKLLQRVATNPKPENDTEPEPAATETAHFSLSPSLRKTLLDEHFTSYDKRHGGWGIGGQKFMDADSVEFSIKRAIEGDKLSEQMAQKTLLEERHLIDPVWGGVYQYSTGGNWSHPHTEKIMLVQSDALRMYSLAYRLWHQKSDLAALKAIHGYLDTFLMSPEGAFYTSQDADIIPGQHSGTYFKLTNGERRKLGIPKVDQHIYARENGWAIIGLVSYYEATGEQSALDSAKKAASWILKHLALPEGGFTHGGTNDRNAVYLGDALAMGQAFLDLYTSTSDRHWLQLSMKSADFIDHSLNADANHSGYLTAFKSEVPYTDRMENLKLARWTNLLSQVTGDFKYRKMAEQAMRFASIDEVAQDGFSAAPLLVDEELMTQPIHITVVGHKSDSTAKNLFLEALKYPAFYKRVEWWDRQEGPLHNSDVQYPQLLESAAFICTNHRCSLPIFKAEELSPRINQLTKKSSPSNHKELP